MTYKVKLLLKIFRARYARAFLGIISAFININSDLGYRKLGNLTSKHTKFSVCKNDCTCARSILSFYLFYVNKIAKNGVFLFNGTQYARPKHGGTQYARPKQGVTRIIMDCGTCIIFIRFRIPDQVYCSKCQNNNNFLLKK